MTRNVWKILLLVLLLQPLPAGASAGTPVETARPLFLAIVIDSSPTSAQTWQQLKAAACQTTDYLRPEDRIEVLRARDGEPSLCSDSLIQAPNLSSRQNLRQCIRDIRQVFFLAKADTAKAVATAFEHLGKYSSEYGCATLVVSTGNLSDAQVRQIRRLAVAYKTRHWSLAFLVQQRASRDLFVAASQDELDAMLLDTADLTRWLERARGQGPVEAEQTAPAVRPGASNQPEGIAPKPTLPPIQPRPWPVPSAPRQGPAAGPEELEPPRSPGDLDHGGTRYILPVYPVPQDKLPFPAVPDAKPPSPAPVPSKGEKPSWVRSVLRHRYTPFGAIGAGILALALLGVLVAKLSSNRDDVPSIDEFGTAGGLQKLMCSAEDQPYDLGEEDSIDTLVIGKGPASAVPLPDDEELEEEHVKVFHRRHNYKIKNLAGQPVVVSGTVVNQGQKVDLLLPATIELTKKSRITLFREPVLPPEHNPQVTGETHDIDNF